MREILEVVAKVAETECGVLLSGPRGSGKRFVARTIHNNSRRRFAPFTVLSCASMPENLLEVELFGPRKSWLASSPSEHCGVFRESNGGTVLLDDIDALPLSLQSRLLTLLEHGRIDPGGDLKPVEVDLRILGATRESIPAKIASGEFRRDLAERLGTVRLVLPPLCDRAEDIPLLIQHFLAGRIHSRSGKPFEISRAAIEACRAYDWPGNIHELESALNHACILCQDGVIQVLDLPHTIQQRGKTSGNGYPAKRQNGTATSNGGSTLQHMTDAVSPNSLSVSLDPGGELVPLKRFMHEQEVRYLQRTLAQVGGNKERAAEILGISLATMYRKLSETASQPVPSLS